MSKALVELALQTLSCSQKELAEKLSVSQTQITKWKQGEYMSLEMDAKLRSITGIGELDAELVVLAGSIESAQKWDGLIHYIAEVALFEADYDTYHLEDDLNVLSSETLSILNDMGVEIPKPFPKELDYDYENCDAEEDEDDLFEKIENNPYVDVIYKIFLALNELYSFYVVHLDDLTDELDLLDTAAANIDPCLPRLAACKIDVDQNFAKNYGAFKQSVIIEFTEWLTLVKKLAAKANVTIDVDLMDLVRLPSHELANEAESYSLEDLFNELKTIQDTQQVIMKKLDTLEQPDKGLVVVEVFYGDGEREQLEYDQEDYLPAKEFAKEKAQEDGVIHTTYFRALTNERKTFVNKRGDYEN